MGKKTDRSYTKEFKGPDNIISLSSVLNKLDQDHIESHTINSDELRECITNVLHQRKKRIKLVEHNMGSLPYPLISSLSDKELMILAEFFDSFEADK